MTVTSNVVCDNCQHEISCTTNSVDYRLALKVKALPIKPGISYVTDMLMYPPIKEDKHFCNLYCLKKWVEACV